MMILIIMMILINSNGVMCNDNIEGQINEMIMINDNDNDISVMIIW